LRKPRYRAHQEGASLSSIALSKYHQFCCYCSGSHLGLLAGWNNINHGGRGRKAVKENYIPNKHPAAGITQRQVSVNGTSFYDLPSWNLCS